MKTNITKERLYEIIENLMAWGSEHSDEWMRCLIKAAGFTEEEITEFDLTSYMEGYEDE